MKALVGAFNQEKALVGAFSVIVETNLKPMHRHTALVASGYSSAAIQTLCIYICISSPTAQVFSMLMWADILALVLLFRWLKCALTWLERSLTGIFSCTKDGQAWIQEMVEAQNIWQCSVVENRYWCCYGKLVKSSKPACSEWYYILVSNTAALRSWSTGAVILELFAQVLKKKLNLQLCMIRPV